MTVILLGISFLLIAILFKFDKINLFFLSFMPLFLILVFELFMDKFLNASKKNIVPILLAELKNPFFVLTITAAIAPIIIFFIKSKTIYRNKKINNKKLKQAERLDDGIISYIMTYIVPLISLSGDTNIVTYTINTILFLVIMILYIKLDLFYINPILEMRYSIYKCDMDGNTKYIMTNLTFAEFKSVIKNGSVNLQKVSNTLYRLQKNYSEEFKR